MSYVEKHLVPGERIVHRTRLHPIVFVPALFAVLVVVLMGALAPGFFLLLPIPAAFALAGWLRYFFSEFVLTDRRVIVKVGVLSRRSFEIALARVEGLGFDETLFGRLLGYGTLVVSGTGGSREVFPDVDDPQALRFALVAADPLVTGAA